VAGAHGPIADSASSNIETTLPPTPSQQFTIAFSPLLNSLLTYYYMVVPGPGMAGVVEASLNIR
jgi:hypothetical protein